MKEKTKKTSKYYNPYPFLVRVLNDLKKPQLLAPQAHCKIMGGEYDQSPLELIPVDKRGERVYKAGMKIELRRLPREDLISLAWAVLAAESYEELESMSQKDIMGAVREKTGEKFLDVGEDEMPETSEDLKERDLEPGDPGVDIEQKPDVSEEEVRKPIEQEIKEGMEDTIQVEPGVQDENEVIKEKPSKEPKSKRKRLETQRED